MTSPLVVLMAAAYGRPPTTLTLPAVITYRNKTYQLVETARHHLTLEAYRGNNSTGETSVNGVTDGTCTAAPPTQEGGAVR